MENASHALLIAGGILISLLVISLVVFMFGNISNTQAEEQMKKEIMQIDEYNKRFEQYNRTILYGSDIISVINLAEDYNKIQASEEMGYTPMNIKIVIIDEISLVANKDDGNYKKYIIRKGIHQIGPQNTTNNVKSTIATIETKIESIEDDYNNKGKPIDTIIKLKQKYDNEIQSNKQVGRITEANNIQEQYKEEMKKYGGYEAVEKDIRVYSALNSTLTSFRAKYFTAKNTEYDNTGRITSITFEEVLPN